MVTGVAVKINKVEGVASTVHLSSQSPGCRETRERREGTSYNTQDILGLPDYKTCYVVQ